MMRGMIIIVTSVMSVLFLKRKLFRHHWTSVGVIFFGVALVGASPIIHGNSNDEETKPLGFLLLIIA